MLCIGCRDAYEIEYFLKKGFTADGIDLFHDEKIIKCDMSKMHEHPYFRNKQYDVIIAVDSIEHCMDLSGFITGLNLLCKKLFICYTTRAGMSEYVNNWDCAYYDFMETQLSKRRIGEVFTEFKLLEIEAKHKLLYFVSQRKS